MTTKSEEAARLATELLPLSLSERLRFIADRFPGKVRFSTSFGKEDQAITHGIVTAAPNISIFTLDTGRLFEETYSTFTATRERLGAQIATYTPDSELLENYISHKGPNAFYESVENRLECCRIRKVEPLQRALKGAQIWVTGLRRDQSANRAELPIVEWDETHQLWKVHPILDWSDPILNAYLTQFNIPVNRLHAKGFPSIGCAPCTRAIKPGEDFRAGRWWWENPNKKECGLHLHKGDKGF
jgi:phosphoadenosine phosphosulfate reductase